MRISDWSSDVCSSDLRIIDLSRKSAEVLGVERPGTARVRVRRVYPAEEVKVALRAGRSPTRVQMASAAPPPAVAQPAVLDASTDKVTLVSLPELGRASCREIVCQ